MVSDPLTPPAPGFLCGVSIITSPALIERVPYPRSPARAKRRAAMGHPQHYRTVPSRTGYMIGPHTMVVHPAVYEKLKVALERERAADTRDLLAWQDGVFARLLRDGLGRKP